MHHLVPKPFTFGGILFLCLALTANCRPTTRTPVVGPTGSLTLPLVRNNHARARGSNGYAHGAIVQQQHINQATRRLALMTGRAQPTKYELLWNLHQRITSLSSSVQSEYALDNIATLLSDHFSVDVSNLSSIFIANAIGNSTHGQAPPGGADSTSNPLHTIGLDIESMDIGYIAKVQVGTPSRDFRLLVDSGSADFWVGGQGCVGDDGGNCGNHTFLGARTSSSYVDANETWAVGYASGNVAGNIVRDNVHIAGLTLKGHTFGVATNESSDFTDDSIPFDGILGLGKYDLSQQRVPTLMQALYTSKLIKEPIVSYKLPRLADGKRNTGEMTLGAMDPKHYNAQTLVRVPNVNKFGFWGANVSTVRVGKHSMGWSRTVVMDTGTTLMIAPQADVDAIHKRIPGAIYQGGSWIVPCNMTTVVSLTIAGQEFGINPADIAFWPLEEGSSQCMSGIAVGGVGPFYLATEWLVGDVFLKNVYFSTNEASDTISIAKPVH